MELKKITDKTYFIENPTNIGVYKIDHERVYIIDSGNDKEAGKKIIKLLDENGLKITGIISTHSNADHIGGNKVIQDRTGAKIYAYGIEESFSSYPILEPSFLYGGYPFKELRHKFLLAQSSTVDKIKKADLHGLKYFPLRGHFFDMIGIETPDDVYFIGDSLFSEETITKYHIFFIYDVREFLNTLDYLDTLKGTFVPSHARVSTDIKELIALNRNKVLEIIELVYSSCQNTTFEDILKFVFERYELKMDMNQYVLVGSTIRSYLSYLFDEGRITYTFLDNKMLWQKKEKV